MSDYKSSEKLRKEIFEEVREELGLEESEIESFTLVSNNPILSTEEIAEKMNKAVSNNPKERGRSVSDGSGDHYEYIAEKLDELYAAFNDIKEQSEKEECLNANLSSEPLVVGDSITDRKLKSYTDIIYTGRSSTPPDRVRLDSEPKPDYDKKSQDYRKRLNEIPDLITLHETPSRRVVRLMEELTRYEADLERNKEPFDAAGFDYSKSMDVARKAVFCGLPGITIHEIEKIEQSIDPTRKNLPEEVRKLKRKSYRTSLKRSVSSLHYWLGQCDKSDKFVSYIVDSIRKDVSSIEKYSRKLHKKYPAGFSEMRKKVDSLAEKYVGCRVFTFTPEAIRLIKQ